MDALVAAAAVAVRPATPDPCDTAAADARDGQRTTTEQRWAVVALHKDNRSNAYIARAQHISRTTVREILARYSATGSPGSGSRSGRPRCTDEALDTAIAFTARVDVFTSPRQIKRKLNLQDVSPRTIDRRLQAAGLFGRVALHKPDYTAAQGAARLRFAQHYRALDWSKVLFAKGVTALDFPPYSPDLNPMENLWATLARAVERYQADNIEALQDAVEAEWNKIDIAHLRNLVASMPARCDAVILANGWHTGY